MIIYLGSASRRTSSGAYARASEQLPLRDAQAALQQTGFTSRTGHPVRLCALTALVSPLPALRRAVSFLWHFPYGHPRLPLATVLLYAVRTFLSCLAATAIIFWSDHQIMTEII
jgi:hypothetical protein